MAAGQSASFGRVRPLFPSFSPRSVERELFPPTEVQPLERISDDLTLVESLQGPLHLIGLLRPKDLNTVGARLDDLVKEVGGTLIRGAGPVGAGSIVEMVISRDAYPRLLAGLGQIGDFTVETRARSLPEQLRIAIRID